MIDDNIFLKGRKCITDIMSWVTRNIKNNR